MCVSALTASTTCQAAPPHVLCAPFRALFSAHEQTVLLYIYLSIYLAIYLYIKLSLSI